MELYETIEETAIRELKEEAGITKEIDKVTNKIKDKFNNDKSKIDFDKGSFLKSVNKLAEPINNVLEKMDDKPILYLILNVISIVLGILLLTKDNATIVLCGIILVYTGIFDAFMYLRSRRLSKKVQIQQ